MASEHSSKKQLQWLCRGINNTQQLHQILKLSTKRREKLKNKNQNIKNRKIKKGLERENDGGRGNFNI